MVNIKTNKQYTLKNKKTRRKRKSLTHMKNTKGGKDNGNADNKTLMKLDVHVTPGSGGDKRNIEFTTDAFYDFYDYLNEVDVFLKNTLNEELIAFTDPSRYKKWKADHATIKKGFSVNLEKLNKVV